MGASKLAPVITRHTQAERVNVERMRANAIEAAEQCGILSLPEIAEPHAVRRGAGRARAGTGAGVLRRGCAAGRPIEVLSRTAAGRRDSFAMTAGITDAADTGYIRRLLMVGPEGGFSEDERQTLLARPNTLRLGLGPRILRADTAAVAALALVQAVLGDWRLIPKRGTGFRIRSACRRVSRDRLQMRRFDRRSPCIAAEPLAPCRRLYSWDFLGGRFHGRIRARRSRAGFGAGCRHFRRKPRRQSARNEFLPVRPALRRRRCRCARTPALPARSQAGSPKRKAGSGIPRCRSSASRTCARSRSGPGTTRSIPRRFCQGDALINDGTRHADLLLRSARTPACSASPGVSNGAWSGSTATGPTTRPARPRALRRGPARSARRSDILFLKCSHWSASLSSPLSDVVE